MRPSGQSDTAVRLNRLPSPESSRVHFAAATEARRRLSAHPNNCKTTYDGRSRQESSSRGGPALENWIKQLFEDEILVRMGHDQRTEDANLGLGWLYYGLTRLARPSKIVVIGSCRGFSPMLFGKALSENVEDGTVCFIDPSLVNDQWKDADQVQEHFRSYGINNIEHHLATTQQFVESEAYRALGEVGIVMIDGYHTAEQAKIDFEAFEPLVPKNGFLLLHDSVLRKTSRIYGEGNEYDTTVYLFVEELKQNPNLQVLDLPFDRGLTIVRKCST